MLKGTITDLVLVLSLRAVVVCLRALTSGLGATLDRGGARLGRPVGPPGRGLAADRDPASKHKLKLHP